MTSYYLTSHQSLVECPACDGEATIYGDEIVNTAVVYGVNEWDETGVQVTLTVAPIAIFCENCRFDISDYELLVEAGLDEGFEIRGTGDDIEYEPEYNNE